MVDLGRIKGAGLSISFEINLQLLPLPLFLWKVDHFGTVKSCDFVFPVQYTYCTGSTGYQWNIADISLAVPLKLTKPWCCSMGCTAVFEDLA